MNSSIKTFFLFTLICIPLLISCGNSKSDSGEEAEHPSVAVTLWTDKMELFMEYPVPVKSKDGKYIIHLTTLDDFKAVNEGSVTLKFSKQSGEEFTYSENSLLREGIFTPVISLPEEGVYNFTLSYDGPKVKESFNIGKVTVHPALVAVPAAGDEEAVSGDITFLKEQQWKTDFSTSEAELRKIRSSINVTGEILPRQNSYAEIISPADGILEVRHNQNLLVPGSKISKGELVAVLSPPLETKGSWIELKLSFQQARSEYERAQRLMDKDAISEREYLKLKREYLARKAGYNEFFASDKNPDNSFYELVSPVSGIVNEVFVKRGQKVKEGEKIVNVIDPSVLWLKVNVFEKDYYRLGSPSGAAIKIPGMDSPVIIDADELKMINEGEILDKNNQTIPLLFDLKNPERKFKVGQTLQLDLYTSSEYQSVCIPADSVYKDEGKEVVFVHNGGETFEKRIIETGDTYKGCISVTNGISEGERVVVDGAYQVKLASTSAEIGHPHAH